MLLRSPKSRRTVRPSRPDPRSFARSAPPGTNPRRRCYFTDVAYFPLSFSVAAVPIRSYPFALLFIVVLAAPAAAQDGPADSVVVAVEDPPTTRDVRVLRAIYNADGPVVSATMRGANWSSYKVFLAAAPALWLGTLAFDDGRNYEAAYLLTVTEASTVGLVFALKNVVQRPRPYALVPGIEPRARAHQGDEPFDPYSFPSGHAAAAFAIATSLSLSYPEWYVVAPSALWATAVALSRPWLGVHYPTDIGVGAVLGVGVAFGVHALSELIIPDRLLGEDPDNAADRPPPPAVRFVIPL